MRILHLVRATQSSDLGGIVDAEADGTDRPPFVGPAPAVSDLDWGALPQP